MLTSSLSRLVPLVLRHLDAYSEIAGEDTRDALTQLVGRILRVLVAAGCALLAATMACVWIIALTWNQPWRDWVPAGLGLLFVVLALGMGVAAIRRRGAQNALFPRVRSEWRRDRKLMARAVETVAGSTARGDHRHESAI